MTACITPDGLARYCQDPVSARDYLGPNLAAFLLTPEARIEAKVDVPEPPVQPGWCLGFFVFDQELVVRLAPRVLAQAFVIPFKWARGRMDSPKLPAGMAEIATRVREVTGHRGYSLHLAEEAGDVDLSHLVLEADSTWAPLAAALELLVIGGRHNPAVFATGAWDGMIKSIDHISKKISALYTFVKPGRKITLFVPGANLDEARKEAGETIDVRPYPQEKGGWRRALSGHLCMLEIPPSRESSSLKERLRYANRYYVTTDRTHRQAYYLDNIVEDLAADIACNNKFPEIERLALGVSHSHELAVLLTMVLRPEVVWLIYTPETRDKIREIRNRVSCKIKESKTPFKPDRAEEYLNEIVGWLREARGSGCIAVEVTGATKLISLVLAAAAYRTEAKTFYLEHDMIKGYNVPEFGTEKIRVLDWLWKL